METIIKATSYPKTAPIQPSFSQITRTTWGKEYVMIREFDEQITFGLFHTLGGWEGEEVVVRWYEHDKEMKLIISDFCDQELQANIHPELFELLRDAMTQPKQVVKKLMELGYQDISHLQ